MYLSLCSLLGLQGRVVTGRMFRFMELSHRVGLGGTESNGWWWGWYNRETGLSPACRLVGTAPEHWSSSRGGGRAKLPCWYYDEKGRGKRYALGFRVWMLGQSAKRSVTHLFY